jgi:hypothetical protein
MTAAMARTWATSGLQLARVSVGALLFVGCGSSDSNGAPSDAGCCGDATAPGHDAENTDDSGSVAAPGNDGGTSTDDSGSLPDAADASPVVLPPATGTPGQWVNVTPAGASATASFSCSNYGTESVQIDPHQPSDAYVEFNCQGIWKSTDYGATWTGPINTGANGAAVGDCAGGITIAPHSTASPPTIYESCIRGAGLGFWASTNGGVDWTSYKVPPSGSTQDVYPPVVDPYDDQHLVMTGHEKNLIVESKDGGKTWSNIPMAAGMNASGGTSLVFFIDTGSAATTATTWLFQSQVTGGTIGTWRTTDSGQMWTQVDTNEHPHGSSQIYQPDKSGVVFAAGIYSNMNTWWGVRRSTDYGKTWDSAGSYANETIVFGTPKNVYTMYGWADLSGPGGGVDPALQVAAQPGTGTWTKTMTPSGMAQDGAAQAAVTSDGTHSIVLLAAWNSGVWQYIEP